MSQCRIRKGAGFLVGQNLLRPLFDAVEVVSIAGQYLVERLPIEVDEAIVLHAFEPGPPHPMVVTQHIHRLGVQRRIQRVD